MGLSNDHLADAIRLFMPHHLFFQVTVSIEGEVWLSLDTQITDHCVSFGIQLPAKPGPSPASFSSLVAPQFHQLPWAIIASGNRSPDGGFKMKRAHESGHTCTFPQFRKTRGKVTNPIHPGRLVLNIGESTLFKIERAILNTI